MPQTQYLSITTANLPAIRKKISELNESASPDVALSDDEIKNVDNLTKQLQSAPKDPKPQTDQLAAVLKIANQWPPSNRLPGLDILRLCAVAPSFVQFTSSGSGTIVDILTQMGVFSPATETPNNTMLAVRVLANMFASEEGRLVMDGYFEEVVSSVKPFAEHSNKNLATAVATLYINYAVLLTSGAPADESKTREQRAQAILGSAAKLLKSDRESETLYRALVAVGTLLSLGSNFRGVVAQQLTLPDLLKGVESGPLAKEPRIRAVIGEIRDQLT